MKKIFKKIISALGYIAKGYIICACIIALAGLGFIAHDKFLYDYKGSSVVMLTKTYKARSGGTGFAIKAPSGKLYTMTNAHICKIGKSLTAHTQDGSSQVIKVIKIYEKHDLCLMEPIKGLRPIAIADSIDLHEKVYLIGHPALRPLTFESGYYVGPYDIKLWIDCKTGKAITNPSIQDFMKMLKGFQNCSKTFDTQHINNIAYGGNSGSPVLNKFGNLIGVLFAGHRFQNTASYTVPLKVIKEFLKDK